MGKIFNPAFIAMLLSLLLVVSITPAAAATTITIGNIFVEPGETSVAPVMIEDVTHVGTVDITIFYDPSIIHVTGAVNSEFDFMYPVINNSAGFVRIGGIAYGEGVSGDIKLADLMLEAVGDADETSTLSITINELKVADATETTIPSGVQNSNFGILNPPQPPVILSVTTGCHWIKWTWTACSNSDFVEVRINGIWIGNCTGQYYNYNVSPHSTQTISLYGYNSSLNRYSTHINQTITIPNFPPVADVRFVHWYNNVGSIYNCRTIFDASVSSDPDGSIAYYQWSFGDGNSGIGELAEHIYGSYDWNGTGYEPLTVTLTVTDDLDPLVNDIITVPVNVYVAGDANGDGRVNILDATIVGLEWGDTCISGWGENVNGDRADLNNDCKVNILDAVIIGACWGHVAS
ncbi:MAG TPA: hypothetical protein C5S50_10920 [Methanosarcinaceae archaeon]|nr:hypothetical protein [Methanosarcinaceae archaeon]